MSMRRQLVVVAILVSIAAAGSTVWLSNCSEAREAPDLQRAAKFKPLIKTLEPLHVPLGIPHATDWLAAHEEPGQTFDQYVQQSPVMPRGKRQIVYVQPLGSFSTAQRKIIELTADFLGRYFGVKTKLAADLPLTVIPESAQRYHPTFAVHQILSSYVLDKVLKPRLPDDAAAYIAFTAEDLWPGEGWNFVFGQASLQDRVGVWSINRNGDPDRSEDEFRQCLLRTLKTASHETGHMFSLEHCTAYECNMCGSNNREEADRRPLEVCPRCLAKICYATGVDPIARFKSLAEFCSTQGMKPEQAFYELSAATLSPTRKPR